jgi:hypothetical protein
LTAKKKNARIRDQLPIKKKKRLFHTIGRYLLLGYCVPLEAVLWVPSSVSAWQDALSWVFPLSDKQRLLSFKSTNIKKIIPGVSKS